MQSPKERQVDGKNQSRSISSHRRVKTSIQELTDKILEHVFSFLRYAQRSRCELVCKRWRDIIWAATLLRLPAGDSPEIEKLSDPVLFTVLSRRGPPCNRLVLECSGKLTCQSLGEIGFLCPNVSCLDLSFKTREQCGCLQAISVVLPHLKILRIRNCDGDSRFCNDALQAAAKNFKALEVLHLANLSPISPDCLKAISPKLSTLSLQGSGLTSDAMQSMTMNCHSLRELDLDYCDVSDQNALFDFLGHFSATLKVLRARNLHFLPNVQWREGLRDLANLEVLEMHRCARVNDPLMEVLANKCTKLQYLDVGSSDVTDVGLLALQNLASLRFLRVGDGVSYGLELLLSKGTLKHVVIVQRFSVFDDVYQNLAARYAGVHFSTELVSKDSIGGPLEDGALSNHNV